MKNQPATTAQGLRRPRRRGNGVLEAALVLPVLLMLSMGMVEFGQFFFVKHTIQAASRDGARTAILSSVTHAQARTAIENTLKASFPTVPITSYTITFQNASNDAVISNVGSSTECPKGTGVKVTISATAGNVSVRPLGVIPPDKLIVGITTMIKE